MGFHLAAADAAADLPALFQLNLHILAQAGALVAFHHVDGGDVADDAVDAAVFGDGWFDIRDQLLPVLRWCRVVFSPLPVMVKFRGFQQLGGVDLDLVRGVAILPQAGKISAV